VHALDHQPPLTLWGHVWRYALVLAISALGWFELAVWQLAHAPAWFAADAVIGAICLVLVGWRRSHPMAVNVVLALACAVSMSAAGPATLALVSLATRRRWREIIPVSLITFGSSVLVEELNPTSEVPWMLAVAFIATAIAVSVGWGMYIGSRRELLATLRERAETAEAGQAARLVQARTSERSRIAREMHDVLAHRISLVTMHAGALAYRTDLDADAMRATASVIQENSHQALVELRAVLGVLRDDPGDAAPERPQPAAEDLPSLIEEARRSGMKVETSHTVDLQAIPVGLGRTLYRVVQEGLTNARKHAPDTLVTVDLDGNPADGLSVLVRNPLHVGAPAPDRPESGLGLLGLSERAALAGGRASHTVTPDREFVLQAWLPWPA
jgi:signal transduction histidine kinase